MKVYAVLENLLKSEPNYITDDGELKKWVVINKAQNYDEELISLLLENEEIKSYFFISVKKVLVFNQALFIQFLEQKNYLNDSFTAYKNKIGLTIDGKFLNQRNEVALVWPYKDCVLEGGQSREEDKRNEIFFNEILAQDEINQLLEPKVLANAKRYTVDGERPWKTFNRNSEGVITDNLIIKGNNLLALLTLKEEFAGKVKLIYIDPPYNTGNDGFKYNDSFNHSTWLTFMRNRLQIAKDLIREDGVIFIQCDDNEQAYLKVLCDEVFDRENFINDIIMKTINPNGIKTTHAKKTILKVKEHILVYKKKVVNFNPQYSKLDEYDKYYDLFIEGDISDLKKCKVIKLKEKIDSLEIPFDIKNEKFYKFIVDNAEKIFQTKYDERVQNNSKYSDDGIYIYEENPEYYVFNKRFGLKLSKKVQQIFGEKSIGNLLGDVWDDLKLNNLYLEGDVSFSNAKKAEHLIYRIIEMSTKENDIVLDYHLGSGTTAAVAHKMNRQYIGIEQMDYIETVAVERLKKVIDGEQGGVSKAVNWQGGGEFVYVELKKYNQNFIDEIAIAKDTKEILNIWENMKAKSFLNYNVDIKKQEEHLEDFKTLTLEEQKQHLVSLLDKNQLYVNRSHMYDADYSVSEEEIALTKDFYQL
jgi:adenine-specific DNA-methyltransferase